jgi:AcrR family transcriptional regulator
MTNKEIILETALQLFGEQGYNRTPTSLIAKTAGVSEGLIFRHFGNKSGLLEAIIQAGMANIAGTMEAYQRPTLDPKAAILQHIEDALTTIRVQESFWRLATKIRFQAEVAQIAGSQLEMVNQFVVKNLTEHFRLLGAENPEQEALLLFALIDGVCLHWLRNPDNYPLEDMKNLLQNKYQAMWVLD